MYYEVEFSSTIYIGVEAESENEAQRLAERVVDASDALEEFGNNATADSVTEIDEDEYDCMTLKEEDL